MVTPTNHVIDAQSWTALFRSFSSDRQPSASLNKGAPLLFLWIFGCVWSLWDGNGSSIESCRHFLKHPQLLREMKVFPSWTRLLPELDNLNGLHSGRGYVGNKRFFTCGTLKNK